MKIQILGSGCPKCQTLERLTREAISEAGINAEIEKITDIDEIMSMGVMMTPAFAINGKVKSSGKILTKDQIIEKIKEEL